MTMAHMSHQHPRTSHFGPRILSDNRSDASGHVRDPGRTDPSGFRRLDPARPHHPRGRASHRRAARTTPRARHGRVTTVTGTPHVPPPAPGVFGRASGHEQVVFCHDEPTGLKAIIAIYSTALGPALGGTRFYPYASEQDALDDVLNLSRGMAYKAALAGLDLGGGKAVIIGDPTSDQDRGAAARLRPLRAVARRPLLHRLRRRHLQRGHGPRRPRVRLRHRPHRRARRRRRLLGAHRVRRLPGHARRGRARPGARPRCTAARSASPASARSASTWSGTSSRTARRSSSPT